MSIHNKIMNTYKNNVNIIAPKSVETTEFSNGRVPSYLTYQNNNMMDIADITDSYNMFYYKPRNLIEVLGARDVKDCFAKLRAKVSTGDFRGLRLGDYVDLPKLNDGETTVTWNESYKNLRVQIVAFDHYYKSNSNDTPIHHVVMDFQNIYKQRQLHSSHLDAHQQSNGWSKLQAYNWLQNGFKNGLVEQIGITPHYFYHYVDWDYKQYYCFLPHQVEYFGWGNAVKQEHNGYTNVNYNNVKGFLGYMLYPQLLGKYYNGSHSYYWTGGKANQYNTYWANVNSNGNVNNNNSNNTNGVAPDFGMKSYLY